MQADLDSAYRAASMGTNSSRLLDDLKRLHDSQQKVLDQFKCMSQAQTDSCSYKPALHEAIIAVLQHWSNETETNKTTLVKDARASLA